MARRSIPPKPKYPPDLASPFSPAEPAMLGIRLTPEYTAARLQDKKVVRNRLRLLAEFHGVVDAAGVIDWHQLAIELAFAHVPGLHPKYGRKRGRPSKRQEQVSLYVEVLKILYTTRIHSVANACKRLARVSDIWGTAATIETRFHEAKRWLLESTPTEEQLFEPKFGYPVNSPHELGIWSELYKFRVHYAKMPAEFP